MKVTLTSNIDRVSARMTKRGDALDKAVTTAAEMVAEAALPEIRRSTVVRSGRLRRGWTVRRQSRGVQIYNPARYAGFQGLVPVVRRAFSKAKRPSLNEILESEVP